MAACLLTALPCWGNDLWKEITGSESRFTAEVFYKSKSINTAEAGVDLMSEEFSLVLSQTQIN